MGEVVRNETGGMHSLLHASGRINRPPRSYAGDQSGAVLRTTVCKFTPGNHSPTNKTTHHHLTNHLSFFTHSPIIITSSIHHSFIHHHHFTLNILNKPFSHTKTLSLSHTLSPLIIITYNFLKFTPHFQHFISKIIISYPIFISTSSKSSILSTITTSPKSNPI